MSFEQFDEAGSAPSRAGRTRGGIQPTGWVQVFEIDADVPTRHVGTGHGQGVMAVDEDAVWVANGLSSTVARLDRRTLEITAVLRLRKTPVAIAAAMDAVWIVCSNGWLWRVWPAGPRAEGVARLGGRMRAIAAVGGWIWVLGERGNLMRLEPGSGEVTLETEIGRGARRLIAAEGALWATCRCGRRLKRIDPDSGAIEAEIRTPRRVTCLAAGDGTVWLGCARRFFPGGRVAVSSRCVHPERRLFAAARGPAACDRSRRRLHLDRHCARGSSCRDDRAIGFPDGNDHYVRGD